MRRLSPLARLALAAVLLVVALGASRSGAALSGSLEEAPSVFSGGTLALGATSALDGAHMRPGQTRSAVVALENTGTVGAALGVAIRDRSDTPAAAALSNVLELRISDCGADAACATPAPAYAGSVAAFDDVALGTIAAGGTRHVRVSLVWDAAKADPSRQGASTAATLVWTAVAGTSK